MQAAVKNDVFGFIKPYLDAHTLGLNTIVELIKDCGYKTVIGDEDTCIALNNIKNPRNSEKILNWIEINNITRLNISYRLDEDDAAQIVGRLVYLLKKNEFFHFQKGKIRFISFAGLPRACRIINKEHSGLVVTFPGGESQQQSLKMLGIPDESIPTELIEGSKYDTSLLKFGKEIISSSNYNSYQPIDRIYYNNFGTKKDTLVERIKHTHKTGSPLIRAHVGPYDTNRIKAVDDFKKWVVELSEKKLLDIVSIGTSQLTQSNFGEDWLDKPNGGGVPINSADEYKDIWEAGRPMLFRTYAGTKNIPMLAGIHEETLNIAWHALSLWWFCRTDGRGPYDLYTNLVEHFKTIKFIAKSQKPFEPNVSHHFAFRGCDDVSYIVSAYLAVKAAKIHGIKYLVLQNMLNTPKVTWGIQDLAKSRALLYLVKELEDANFHIFLQPRAGLAYFSPNLEEAKAQLSAITALMDDIDPDNKYSPPIIHVVSYSEASHLATPNIINESIKITQHSLKSYRKLRKENKIENMAHNIQVNERKNELVYNAKLVIASIEKNIKKVYTPEGFYTIFASGYLPVPYLWGDRNEFPHAIKWKTKPYRGGVKVVNSDNKIVNSQRVANYAEDNIDEVKYNLFKMNNGMQTEL